jgi:uncharacterized repeat protein (TIGR01451 family)
VKISETSVRRWAWTLLAGASALLLVVGLSLLLSHAQAVAQPVAEVAALSVDKQANTSVATPGDTLTYTIRVQESESSITVLMTDTLPAEVTYVAGTLDWFGPGSASVSDGVVTWNGTLGFGSTAVITFSARISTEIAVTEIENTAEVTGGGGQASDSVQTTVLSGDAPNAQIRTPDMDAWITQKGSLVVGGIAWDSAITPPYLMDDPYLSVEKISDRSYWVSWTRVDGAEQYIVQEATEPDFSDQEPTSVFSPTTNLLVSKSASEDGTYYYRVQAAKYGDGPSRWSNVGSVTTPWTAGGFSLSASEMSADVAANGTVTVQVSVDDGSWNTAIVTPTAWGGWEWAYEWTPLPEERNVQHAIHARAMSGASLPGAADTITVTLNNKNYVQYLATIFKRWPPIPYAPTLQDIANTDQDGDYTVQWSYDYTQYHPVTYTLQEATDENFTNPVYYFPGSSTQMSFSDKDSGTYYYRVWGHNAYGAGERSSVKSVLVRSLSFHYDFNSSTKVMDPWPIRRTSYWQGDQGSGRVTWTEEHDGTMYIVMADKWDFTIASPFEQAPPPPYVIQTRVKIHDPSNLVAYGIIFGGNAGSPCPAYRDTGCLSHYYRLEVIWDGGSLKAGFKRIDYHEPESSEDRGKGRGSELVSYREVTSDEDSFHTWKFVVESDGIDIYFDGSLFASLSDSRYVNDPYFGVYASTYEYKPAIGRFDYFYVDPD